MPSVEFGNGLEFFAVEKLVLVWMALAFERIRLFYVELCTTLPALSRGLGLYWRLNFKLSNVYDHKFPSKIKDHLCENSVMSLENCFWISPNIQTYAFKGTLKAWTYTKVFFWGGGERDLREVRKVGLWEFRKFGIKIFARSFVSQTAADQVLPFTCALIAAYWCRSRQEEPLVLGGNSMEEYNKGKVKKDKIFDFKCFCPIPPCWELVKSKAFSLKFFRTTLNNVNFYLIYLILLKLK